MDSVGPATRSFIMSRVGQRDTDIELLLRQALWREGVRYRKNVKIVGTPDLAFKGRRLVVFVDSCFWHGCRFHCRRPKSNTAFWEAKIERNRRRDVRVTRHYRRRGWTVLRFREHALRQDLERCVRLVADAVLGP